MNDRSKKTIAMPTLELAREVLEIEADAVRALASRLDERFLDAVGLILACQGRVVVTGVGKSGHIARKIASTLASTGTPAFFLHAAEASHGDLGMITRDDVVLALSNSGKTDELLTIIPLIKRQGAKLIAVTGNAESALAREADVHLDARVAQGSLPAQPRADGEHHRRARARRRPCRRAARRARLRRTRISRALIRAARSAAGSSPTFPT